jgi:hypothetical protein
MTTKSKKLPKYTCCLCNHKNIGYGNNPAPINRTGRCCDYCNTTLVLPVRVKIAFSFKENK